MESIAGGKWKYWTLGRLKTSSFVYYVYSLCYYVIMLFIIFLEAVIDNSHSGAVINRVVIRDLRFTDDNALLSENVSVL